MVRAKDVTRGKISFLLLLSYGFMCRRRRDELRESIPLYGQGLV
jgi:hypothetical protein